ncbi:LLM class flavin-dependent oxidoreductase [Umezawaea beigongshangensis]|uniref:LLM class flavin-dependent oxidoreductase n=1 Tax=Umezawaea beigongshangensis TaxID=2780383 RepID=UPI0027DDE978|nr:LLM class flavin-dependent oxidoreductase [Umezawaea beigongshangensis]
MQRRLGFLSLGHYQDVPWSRTRTAADALTQAIEIASGAEQIGFDGAWIRVHHYQRQFSSPWALLSAMAARTERIELGTAVVDMRYENPLLMAELAAAADLISGGRLQLGLSRGSQEPPHGDRSPSGSCLPRGSTRGKWRRSTHAASATPSPES